jgi:hypothetical protein
MSPELTAFAHLLGDLYHDSGTIVRLVEQAGMDATKLTLSNTTPANAWFAVCTLAKSEGLLPQLIENVAGIGRATWRLVQRGKRT